MILGGITLATDIGNLDPLSVSMRDYVDGTNAAHESLHAREREAEKDALDSSRRFSETVITDHFASHEMQHQAVKVAFENYLREITEYKVSHVDAHKSNEKAVQVALDAVQKLADLHATAHSNEHEAHEKVHQREILAADITRRDLDARLAEFNLYRVQQREQAATFMSRTEIVALFDRTQGAVEAFSRAADNAHMRMDSTSQERVVTLQSQIDKLNLAAATGIGASQRTTYLIGAGFTVITILIAIVGIYIGYSGK